MAIDFGKLCDDIATKQAAIDRIELKAKEAVKPLQAEVDKLEEQLKAAMKDANLVEVKGKKGSAKIAERLRISIQDFTKFTEFLARKKAFHLFERRISVTAYREMKESLGNKPIPGLGEFIQETLNVTKA
jgi:hypothetical protein